MAAQAIVRHLPVGEKVVEAILQAGARGAARRRTARRIVRGFIAWGPGPRASQAFMLAVRARALIEGTACAVDRRCRGAGADRSCAIAWR